MGQPKQLLPWGNTTLLGHAVREALPVGDRIFVVLGAHADILNESLKKLPVSILNNPKYKHGLGASLAYGAASIANDPRGFDRLIVALADQPAVDSAYLLRMVDAASLHPGCIIASSYGKRAGVPALFPAAYFPELSALGGDAGAGAVLQEHAGKVIALETPAPIYDIDTPEDYRRHEGDQKYH